MARSPVHMIVPVYDLQKALDLVEYTFLRDRFVDVDVIGKMRRLPKNWHMYDHGFS